MPGYILSDDQLAHAESLVEPSLAFLATQNHPLNEAIVRYCWADGPEEDIVEALSQYQNPDGGFGQGLEVDITCPASNPFAARLAMQVMLSIPLEASEGIRDQLRIWLAENQHEDGDWHFAPEVYDAELPPWFAGWEFPSLNPACCVAGTANLVGIATPQMLGRVAALFEEKASLEVAASGEFYGMLPYVEYLRGVDFPNRSAYIGAVEQGILKANAEGSYADAQHFLDHAINTGPAPAARLPTELMCRWRDALLEEPSDDGGWPTPYDPAWRPWATASAMMTLARLKRGV